MRFLVDSSSLINLVNADAHKMVFHLPEHEFWIPPLVVGETDPSCAADVLQLQGAGLVNLLDDDQIDGDLFLYLLGKHGLGSGETECIAVALNSDFGMCCDDGKARTIARTLIGDERVVGTIKLLRWCVDDAITTCDGAFQMFEQMKTSGGFLPNMQHKYFCGAD